MEIRKLKGKDIFTMSRILKEVNIKISPSTVVDGQVVPKTDTEVGMELMLGVFENIHLAEKSINKFIADLTNKTIKEVEDFTFAEYTEVITMIKEDDEVQAFLGQVMK